MMMAAGAVKVDPLVGLVMPAAGGELEITVTVTAAEAVVTPRLSDATAVSVWEPGARFTARL